MGANCCGEERSNRRRGKRYKKKEKSAEEEEKKEYVRKPEGAGPDPEFFDFISETIGEDPFAKTSVYYCPITTFNAGWKKELLNSYRYALQEGNEKAIPFLITGIMESNIYVNIVLKEKRLNFLSKSIKLSPTILLEQSFQRKFTAKSMDEGQFFSDLTAFLNRATSEGLEPIGCLNDFKNNCVFYFYFLKTTDNSKEKEDFSEMSWYTCQSLRVREKDQISTILTEWANQQHLYYKLSFPIYSENFKKVLFQTVILEIIDTERPFNYFLVEAPKVEEIGDEINVLKYEQEFIGVIGDFHNSYLVYNIEIKDEQYIIDPIQASI